MPVTASQVKANEANKDNFLEILVFKIHRGSMLWLVKTCKICYRPTLVHADHWSERCNRPGEVATQSIAGEYIEQFNM